MNTGTFVVTAIHILYSIQSHVSIIIVKNDEIDMRTGEMRITFVKSVHQKEENYSENVRN